jgi:hypothetical protein
VNSYALILLSGASIWAGSLGFHLPLSRGEKSGSVVGNRGFRTEAPRVSFCRASGGPWAHA